MDTERLTLKRPYYPKSGDYWRFSRRFQRMPGTGCWHWLGYLNVKGGGYGSFKMGGRKYGAHRASWILKHGPIPLSGPQNVLHKCDNPRCVNPDHLYLGTHLDNIHDWIERVRGPLPPKQPRPNMPRKPRQRIERLHGWFKGDRGPKRWHPGSKVFRVDWDRYDYHTHTYRYADGKVTCATTRKVIRAATASTNNSELSSEATNQHVRI